MEIAEKEKYWMAVGVWFGMGATMMSLGFVLTARMQFSENMGFSGIVLGLMFVVFGFVAREQALKTVYIPDKIMKIVFLNAKKEPVDYFRELAEEDIKEKGWDK